MPTGAVNSECKPKTVCVPAGVFHILRSHHAQAVLTISVSLNASRGFRRKMRWVPPSVWLTLQPLFVLYLLTPATAASALHGTHRPNTPCLHPSMHRSVCPSACRSILPCPHPAIHLATHAPTYSCPEIGL